MDVSQFNCLFPSHFKRNLLNGTWSVQLIEAICRSLGNSLRSHILEHYLQNCKVVNLIERDFHYIFYFRFIFLWWCKETDCAIKY